MDAPNAPFSAKIMPDIFSFACRTPLQGHFSELVYAGCQWLMKPVGLVFSVNGRQILPHVDFHATAHSPKHQIILSLLFFFVSATNALHQFSPQIVPGKRTNLGKDNGDIHQNSLHLGNRAPAVPFIHL